MFFRNDFTVRGQQRPDRLQVPPRPRPAAAGHAARPLPATARRCSLRPTGCAAGSRRPNSAWCSGRSATARTGCSSPATPPPTSSSSSSSWRGDRRRWPAPSTCRRSASSTRARWRPTSRSRPWSGSRSAAAAPWSGPIVGAIGVNALKSWATRAYPDLWLIILGTLFILVVLFLPGGIVSLPGQARAALAQAAPPERRSRSAGGRPEPDPPARPSPGAQ